MGYASESEGVCMVLCVVLAREGVRERKRWREDGRNIPGVKKNNGMIQDFNVRCLT
jgi:hypothetical protein